MIDPIRWSERTPMSWKAMVLAGLSMVAMGIVGGSLAPIGVLGVPVWGGLLTMGGGLVFLGARKARGVASEPPRALSASEQRVVDERARRVLALLGSGGGEFTFERIASELRWTEEAVLSALLHMKETGDIIEDLNLDSGQWVYRPQDPDLRGSDRPPLMLEERKARYENATSDELGDP